MGVRCPCPPIRNDIVTQRHLFSQIDDVAKRELGTCTEGERIVEEDGCNYCVCLGGHLACTMMYCGDNANEITITSETFEAP